ncbi:hypothetical protein Syun_025689 [Stephania yunnanensis]|uniref:Uncharacterized protein n=1 Tax=Stephania yunnanensis TaxID=152371 RepID=A0AAP0ESM2_9MAGN
MRTFHFRRENGHRNIRIRGECRSGVTNWCHHNNTRHIEFDKLSTLILHVTSLSTPAHHLHLHLHPLHTPLYIHTNDLQNREKNRRRGGGRREPETQLRNLGKGHGRAKAGKARTLLCCSHLLAGWGKRRSAIIPEVAARHYINCRTSLIV